MDQNIAEQKTYVFGEFHLNPEAKIVGAHNHEIHLAPRPFEVLCFLVANHDRVVSRSELLDEFWDGRDVYDDALRKCVGSIRKALKDEEKPSRYIETRYGGGYRLIADVKVLNGNGKVSTNGSIVDPEPPSFASGYEMAVATNHGILPRLRPFVLYAVVAVLLLLTLGFYMFVPREQSSASTIDPASAIKNIRSIAVMPLKNLTGDVSNEYFSDGVTESLITELARAGELKIISRSSTFTLKGKEVDPREIGRQLGVDAILEGSLQRTGDLINVRVRLVDTRDGQILWTSNDFERQFSAAYDLQDAIACNVAAELRTEVCRPIGNHRTSNGIAYQEYLKGRYEWNKRTSAGIKKSIEHYKKAIALDPKYALAFSGLSDSYLQGIWHVPFDSAEALPKALEMALTAVKLDDNLAEAHTALSSVYSLHWKWDDSERELKRAIELNPRYARAFHVNAFSQMLKGRHDEALESIDKAAEIDPLNLVISTDKGNLLLAAGRMDDAYRQWEKTLAMDPNFIMAREHRIVAYELADNDTGAIEDYSAILKANGQSPQKIAEMRQTAQKNGFKEVRRREYNILLANQKRGEPVSSISLANYAALLGQKDETFRWLEKAFIERNGQMVLIVSPQFSSIHDDPRYTEILARIGLAR